MAKPAPPVGTIEDGHRFVGGDPAAEASWQPVTGEDFLKGMDAGRASLIRSIANGDAAIPAGFAITKPAGQQLLADLARYDPTFSATDLPARIATRKSFTSGAMATNRTAANTTLSHMAALSGAIEGLGNMGPDARDHSFANAINPLNAIGPINNMAAHALADISGSNARFNSFNMTKQAVATEMTRLFRGTGGAEADVQGWLSNFGDAQGPDALRASVKTGMELVRGRLQAMADSYQEGMGRATDPITFLTPENQAAFKALAQQGYLEKPTHGADFTRAAPRAHAVTPSYAAAVGGQPARAPAPARAAPTQRYTYDAQGNLVPH